jgi:hypothetical protein
MKKLVIAGFRNFNFLQKKDFFQNFFKLRLASSLVYKTTTQLPIYNNISYNFGAKNKPPSSGDKFDKKAKKEKEKATINKEYQDISPDELKSNYRNNSEKVITEVKEKLYEIRVSKTNPKILDNIQVR